MKNLSVVDCIAIAVSWIGVASIAFLAKDVVVAIICIAAAYYLAKWIILRKDSALSAGDVLAIAMGWGGGIAITYFVTKNPVVAIICIAAAYYLAKWTILKKEVEG
ncbi:MAG: hypothetical protein AAB869_00100 [Patescibacteria group bacterium]